MQQQQRHHIKQRALKASTVTASHAATAKDVSLVGILSPVISIMREKHDEQIKLNFALFVSFAGIHFASIDSRMRANVVKCTRVQCQADINSVYEKYSLRLKRIEIVDRVVGAAISATPGERSENVLLTSDVNAFDSSMFLNATFERLDYL